MLNPGHHRYPPAAVAWSIWGLGALLYLIGFYQRDAAGHVLLFGGRDSNGTALGDTWLWDGTTWTAYGGAAPPARFGAGGGFLFSHFTIADCMLAPVATRIRTYDLPAAPATRAGGAALASGKGLRDP